MLNPEITDQITSYFAKLGLSEELARIYLALYAHGPLNISETSRLAKVERTKLYRLLDELESSHLVQYEEEFKKGALSASPFSNLQLLINKRESELASLKDNFDILSSKLKVSEISNATTKVKVYSGKSGLRQMLWNQLRSSTELLNLSYLSLDEFVGADFTNKWLKELSTRELSSRTLHSPDFKLPTKQILSNTEYQLLQPTKFMLSSSFTVYDNTTMYIDWKDGSPYGLELHNSNVADVDRQFFEGLWQE
jgi:sugar-specific transcriptional regulator TrmB